MFHYLIVFFFWKLDLETLTNASPISFPLYSKEVLQYDRVFKAFWILNADIWPYDMYIQKSAANDCTTTAINDAEKERMIEARKQFHTPTPAERPKSQSTRAESANRKQAGSFAPTVSCLSVGRCWNCGRVGKLISKTLVRLEVRLKSAKT